MANQIRNNSNTRYFVGLKNVEGCYPTLYSTNDDTADVKVLSDYYTDIDEAGAKYKEILKASLKGLSFRDAQKVVAGWGALV